MYINILAHKTKEFKKFLAMSDGQFDRYMCKTYPDQFEQRNLPMTQTCMCWGFEIGKGWRYYLNDLCAKLKLISKASGIIISFVQIKEKYGAGAFYYSCRVDDKAKPTDKDFNIWHDIIDSLITNCEDICEHTCEETGVPIDTAIEYDGWIYPLSKSAFNKKVLGNKQDGN